MALLKVLNPPLPWPKKHGKSCVPSVKQARTIMSRFPRLHRPRQPGANALQAAYFGQSWANWRRRWQGYLSHMWKVTLTPTEKEWWDDQAAAATFPNYKNELKTLRGYELFLWYQFRCFDLHNDWYAPYPNSASLFPMKFTPPWSPPTLEEPTIISASSNGNVVIRCLNQTPEGIPLEPHCRWTRNPPVSQTFPKRSNSWFYTSYSEDGDHTEYTYDLSVAFPRIKPGTRAALTHCYGNRKGGPGHDTGYLPPSYAADGGGAYVPWTNPMNVCTYDASVTEARMDVDAGKTTSNALLLTDFEFDPPLPNDAVITAIEADIMAQCADYRFQVQDLTIRLLKDSLPVGENKAQYTWPSDKIFPWTYLPYYGPDTLWGTTWAPADINNPGFGLAITVHTPAAYGLAIAWIAYARIKVWYTIPYGWFTLPTLTQFTFS
jgi:hypothetical protein